MTESFRIIFSKSRKMAAMAVLLIVLFIAFIAGSVIVKAGGSSLKAGENKLYTNITVEDGDTLWSIAEKHMDYDHYSNVYDYMGELRKMNNMNSDQVCTGDNLIVTYYASTNE